MKKPETRARQVSIPTKFAYGMGHSLISVKNMLFHFFFLFYFSNVLGVPKEKVLLITMIALFIDAFSDPIMGQISDNFRSKRWGRRHLFVLWGALPTTLGLIFLFSPPATLSTDGLFFWGLTFTLVIRLGLTVLGVPYASLGGELSTHYAERTNIFSIRELMSVMFNILVFFLAFFVYLPDTADFEDGMMNAAGYGPLATTLAIIALISTLISIYGTRHTIPKLEKAYRNDPRTKWTDTFTQVKYAAEIKPFVWLSLAFSTLLILYGAGSALSFYLGVYLWQFSQEAKGLIAILPIIIQIFAVILASLLATLLDKKTAAMFFSFIFLACGILPYALYLTGQAPDIANDGALWFIVFFSGLGYSGLTGVIIMSYSMLADVTDAMELQTGKRQEGLLFSAFSFAQKLTFAIGTAVATLTLIIIQFPDQVEPSQVPQAKIDALAMASIVMTVLIGLIALLCFWLYPLSRANHAKIQEQLKQ